MLDHYAQRWRGPDESDAVIFTAEIGPDVTPTVGQQTYLPRGRCFSLSPDGYMRPGVNDSQELPIAVILIGSDSDSGDATGGPYALDPSVHTRAQVPFKDRANLPFWSLDAGYQFETDGYDHTLPETVYAAGTPLTATADLNDFSIAGVFTPGQVYVDHIVGVVVEGPGICGVNTAITTIKLQGRVIPRIPSGKIALLRA
jgi:hypothetical protein